MSAEDISELGHSEAQTPTSERSSVCEADSEWEDVEGSESETSVAL